MTQAMQSEFLKKSCPSCEQHYPAQLYMSSTPRAEGLNLTEIKQYWSGFFKEKIFFSYQRCHACHLLYCDTFFNEQQLQQLYCSMSDNTANVPLAPLIKTQRGYFQFLKQHTPLRGGYLEFGPDIGLFTENCIQEGNFDHYWLLEPNKEVWPELQNRLKTQTYDLLEDLPALDKIPDHSISVCVMIHVLDHLLEPAKVLQQIKRKLMHNAILIFVTHDEQSLLAKMTRAKWPPYCLQHPHLFNQNTIKTLLQKNNLDVVACHKTRNYFPVTYLMQHFLWLLGLRKLKLPRWHRLQIGLKLGNIITIATAQD